MGIKELLLNKGWAGRTLSRSETVDRLNPVIHSLTALMHAYDRALTGLDGEIHASLSDTQKLLRADIGKLSETVLSGGGVAYTGVDQEPGGSPSSDDPAEILAGLLREEESFRETLDGEREVEHQIRTRAVLENVARNSSERVRLVRRLGRL